MVGVGVGGGVGVGSAVMVGWRVALAAIVEVGVAGPAGVVEVDVVAWAIAVADASWLWVVLLASACCGFSPAGKLAGGALQATRIDTSRKHNKGA